MKKNEVMLLLVIAIAGTATAAILANVLFGNPTEARETVPLVTLLPAGIDYPDPLVFNAEAIDPTQTVCIGTVGAASDPACEGQFTPEGSGETVEGEGETGEGGTDAGGTPTNPGGVETP